MASNELIAVIASNIKLGFEQRLQFQPCDDMELIVHPLDDYPSVTKGPVDVTKLKSLTKFEPYDLDEAMKESIDFYNQAYKKFPEERKKIEKLLRTRYFGQKRLEKLYKLEEFENFIRHMSS